MVGQAPIAQPEKKEIVICLHGIPEMNKSLENLFIMLIYNSTVE
jgi:hypothetical protein